MDNRQSAVPPAVAGSLPGHLYSLGLAGRLTHRSFDGTAVRLHTPPDFASRGLFVFSV